MSKIKIFLFFLLCAAPLLSQDNLAPILGGMVESDSWIIRKDKNEEEFIGNVRYENENFKIKADRALSRRAAQEFTIEGEVYAQYTSADAQAALKAERVFYSQAKDTGYATAKKNKQVEAAYNITDGASYKLYGDRLDFADKFTQYKMTGWAELSDNNNTLYAGQMDFDFNTGIFEATRNRPLMWGFTDDGDYAVQADTITARTREGLYRAEGRVQGWVTAAKDLDGLTNK